MTTLSWIGLALGLTWYGLTVFRIGYDAWTGHR